MEIERETMAQSENGNQNKKDCGNGNSIILKNIELMV